MLSSIHSAAWAGKVARRPLSNQHRRPFSLGKGSLLNKSPGLVSLHPSGFSAVLVGVGAQRFLTIDWVHTLNFNLDQSEGLILGAFYTICRA